MLGRFIFQLAIFTLFIGSAAMAGAQSVKQRLFDGAYLAQQAAEQAQAPFLAPANYQFGQEALTKAERLYSKGKPVEVVREQLVTAIGFYELSKGVVKKAETELATALSARKAGQAMNAKTHSPKDWMKAEKLLATAIVQLEEEKLGRAKKTEEKAILLYRDVELVAIKAEYLNETRALIAEAEQQKIGKFAPLTLRRAKELLATAEVELTENRYDVDLPRSLAKQARYEARHAFHIAKTIKANRDQDMSEEQWILLSEKPLQRVAASVDINAEFDKGLTPIADELIEYIEMTRDSLQGEQQSQVDKDIQIAGYRELLNEFAQLHGGEGTSIADLEKMLLAQEANRERLKKLEAIFERSEARVFRQANDVFIRLTGLSFASGSSAISAESYSLLSKVLTALELYTDSKVVVEGHTDSYGGDDANLVLSKNRADEVRRFIILRSNMSEALIESIGYGETKPFANNDTPQGRALNRRIDIRLVLPK
jgi:outer membrane protein OmpA-like peptidoglycan-associated protein